MRKLSREVRLLLALLLLLAVWTGAFLLRCSPATPAGACRRTAFLMFHPVRALFLEAAPAEGGLRRILPSRPTTPKPAPPERRSTRPPAGCPGAPTASPWLSGSSRSSRTGAIPPS